MINAIIQQQVQSQPGMDITSVLLGFLIAVIPTVIALIKVVGPAIGRIAEAQAKRREEEVVTKKLLNERLEEDMKQRDEDREEYRRAVDLRVSAAEERVAIAEGRAIIAEARVDSIQKQFDLAEANHAHRYGGYEQEIGVLRKNLSHMTESYARQSEELETEKTARIALQEEVSSLNVRLDGVIQERDVLTLQVNSLQKQLDDRFGGG